MGTWWRPVRGVPTARGATGLLAKVQISEKEEYYLTVECANAKGKQRQEKPGLKLLTLVVCGAS